MYIIKYSYEYKESDYNPSILLVFFFFFALDGDHPSYVSHPLFVLLREFNHSFYKKNIKNIKYVLNFSDFAVSIL